MDKEEVIGKIALIQFERKEKLRRKITDPAYRYYFRGVCMSIGSILFLLLSVALPALSFGFGDPSFLFVALFFLPLFVAISEIVRLRERFNALVKLMEIEKEAKDF